MAEPSLVDSVSRGRQTKSTPARGASRRQGRTRKARGLGPTDKRREEVIASGRLILLNEGLAALTMRRVSEVAGFTTGALTHHFPDKESVLIACFEGVAREWVDRVDVAFSEAALSSDPLADIAAIASLAIPHGADLDELPVWLEFAGAAQRRPDINEIYLRAAADWEGKLEKALMRAVDRGVIPHIPDIRTEAMALARLVDGIGVTSTITHEWRTGVEALDRYFELLGVSAANRATIAALDLRTVS